MSRGNVRGGDPLQRSLELEEYRSRLYNEQHPRPPSPVIDDVPIIEDGLEYPTVPTEYEYPAAFKVDLNARVAKLNSYLLVSYGWLGDLINEHALAQAILERNRSRPELNKWQLEELQANVHIARCNINVMMHRIDLLIGEVDAVGGAEAYYVPDQLKSELRVPRSYLVPSSSLAYLAEHPHYIVEECPVQSYVYMGDDTKQGRVNQELKVHFEKLAYNVNRIQYLMECGCKDFFLSTLQDRLKRMLDEVDLKTDEGYLTIPSDLDVAIVRILSAAKKKKEEQKRREAEAMEKKKVEEMLYQKENLEMQKRKKQDRQKGKKPGKSPWMA